MWMKTLNTWNEGKKLQQEWPNQSSICIKLLAKIAQDLAKNIFKFQKEQILNLIYGYPIKKVFF